MDIRTITSENWANKYSPKKLEEMILPDNIRGYFNRYLEGQRQPLVLYGKPGTGKTQTATLLAKGERILIDCGRPDDLERIRRMLINATSLTLSGERRMILIDDCENLSSQAKHALRELERLTGINDFILTTNRIDLLDDPLRSRLTELCFDFTLEDKLLEKILSKLVMICNKEDISVPEKASLRFIIKKHYPDMRKILGELQKMILLRPNPNHLKAA